MSLDSDVSRVEMAEPHFESLPQGLAERYGLRLPTRGEPLARGATRRVVRAGDFVVRLDRTDPESVRWEHALLRFLSEDIEQVIVPLALPWHS